MAFPYYPFFPGDYLRDTRRLTLLQHGAYHLLLHEYMASGKPLRGDADAMCRVCGALSGEERMAVEFVLTEFFVKEGPLWRHKRCDAELAKLDSRRAAASSSAKYRWDHANAMRTHSEGNANQNQNQNQNQTTTKAKTTPKVAAAPPDLVPAELWEAFRQNRQALKAPLTPQAEVLLVGKLRRLQAEGENVERVVEQSIERGWKGFFPVDGVRSGKETPADKRAKVGRAIWGNRAEGGDERAIDGIAERVD